MQGELAILHFPFSVYSPSFLSFFVKCLGGLSLKNISKKIEDKITDYCFLFVVIFTITNNIQIRNFRFRHILSSNDIARGF